MGNTRTLGSVAKMYKVAGPINWLKNIPSTYAKRFSKEIAAPIKEKGILGGAGSIIKKQLIPEKYTTGLRTKVDELGGEIGELAKQGPARHDDLIKLRDSQREMISRINRINTGQGTLGDKARQVGHYTMGGLGGAATAGFPAYGMYSAATAPEGEGLSTLGSSLGETAGFIGLGPVGVIPSILGSMAGGSLGEAAGDAAQDIIAPKSLYKKMVEKATPQQKQLVTDSIIRLIRGSAPRAGHMGFSPGQKITPRMVNYY